MANKEAIIDLQEIDKQGNFIILTVKRNKILFSNSNNLYHDGVIEINFIKENESKKLKEVKESEEDYINEVAELIKMEINLIIIKKNIKNLKVKVIFIKM